MKPLRRGAARTALAEGLGLITDEVFTAADLQDAATMMQGFDRLASVQAAVLGGAVEQAIEDMLPSGLTSTQRREWLRDFWRLAGENLWRLTRTLDASNLLTQLGEDK